MSEKWIQRLREESLEFARLHDEYCNDRDLTLECRVVACGLVNAGKSTLLNALTGNLQNEYFATRAIRETTSTKTLTLDDISYVDTPGIDACDNDDEEAWRGISSADVIIFVHNLCIGTLETSEVDFLVELLRRRPDLRDRILVALTWAESAEDDDQELRASGIQHLLDSVLPVAVPLYCTSFTMYRKGMLESKPRLVELSGINELQRTINELPQDHSWLEARDTRQRLRAERLRELIDQAVLRRQVQIRDIRNWQTGRFSAWRTDFMNLATGVRDRIARISR